MKSTLINPTNKYALVVWRKMQPALDLILQLKMEHWWAKKNIILWLIFLVLEFQACCIGATQLQNETGRHRSVQEITPMPPAYYFLVEGDVYESGLFHAVIQLGITDQVEFFLDIDTGSDLTWITCSPSNIKLLKPISTYASPHKPYLTSNNLVSCEDQAICGSVSKPVDPQCSAQYQQCDYQIEYADHGTSLGVLVQDIFLLKSSLNGHSMNVEFYFTFGCGYHQEFGDPAYDPPFAYDPPYADGVLGLGNGTASFLSQLTGRLITKKFVALCLSNGGPGYLALGDSPESRTQGIIWMPLILDSSPENMIGPADLFYDTGNKLASGLRFVLDSGTTYNYFSHNTYQAVLSWVNELIKNVATPTEDVYLPVCWKPLTSSSDVLKYFSSLRFVITDNVYFELESDDYLVISPQGNVCLGILDGQELGSGFEDVNIVGDISIFDKLVIYDYENWKLGWITKDCTQLPEQLSPRANGRPNKHRLRKNQMPIHWRKKKNDKKRKQELSDSGNV